MTAVDAPLTALVPTLHALPGVGLDTVERVASLTRRFDDKFLLGTDDLGELVAALDGDWSVLEVDQTRSTTYHSTYFDTADLATYRHHLQGRRRRYKVRARRYGLGGRCMLEIKLKATAGRTDKLRWDRTRPVDAALDAVELRRVAAALDAAYGISLPGSLHPSISTVFDRLTLVERTRGERVTVDVSLAVGRDGVWCRFNPGVAIVETKSPRRVSAIHQALRRLGHRPVAVSKYCVGAVSLHPALRGNPWIPALRRLGPIEPAGHRTQLGPT